MLPSETAQELGSTSEARLRLKLLGVPRISWDRNPLALVRRQARAILFRLAVAAAPVGREALADLLWPDREPAAARRNLVRLLSALRGELPGDDLLRSDRTAVWLDPTHYRSDVEEFNNLAGSSDAGNWESAVALYRGPFLSGFVLSDSPTFDHWQQTTGYELERRYLDTLTQLVEHLQAGGAAVKATDYAKQYLAIDDLSEMMHCTLIKLYAASGRRTAALQQYSRCVKILHRELGVEPLPETRAAFEAARDGAPTAHTQTQPRPIWSTLPGLDLPLTGRETTWHELQQAYQQRQAGGVILISGAPGIGKSRLMQEFASSQSSLVLVGNCHTGSQALSFQPLVQALRLGLQEAGPADLAKPIWLAELAVLLPEIREQFPDLPAPLHLAPDQSQARLLEALSQVFRSLAADSGLLLCLDDLHGADEGTLAWLQYTTGQLANSGICLLVTFRIEEAGRLIEWRRTLSRTGLGNQIRLQALNVQTVEALLKMTGSTEVIAAKLAGRLHQATGGNAFFLLETIRELLESGRLETEDEAVPLPQSVREAVLRRADRLEPLSRQVLEMAAVLLPLLTLSLLAKTSARSELEVAEAVDELVLRQFMVPDSGRFRFQHDLTRETVYGAISDWRRRLLHRRAAQTLAQQPQRDSDRSAIIAAHFEAGESNEEAVSYYRQAAVQAQAINTLPIAASYLRRALELLPTAAESTVHESDLLERLGDCLRLTGHFEDALVPYEKALDSSPAIGAITRARVLGKIAETRWPMDDVEAAIENARQALEELAPIVDIEEESGWKEWIDIQLGLAYIYYWQLDLPGIMTTLTETEPILRRFGNDRQKRLFQYPAIMSQFLRHRYRLDHSLLDEIRVLLMEIQNSGDLLYAANVEFVLGFALLWAGDLAPAEKHLRASLAVCEDLEVQYLRVRNLVYLQVLERLRGNQQIVAALWSETREIILNLGSTVYVSSSDAMRSWLAYKEGDRQTAVKEAQSAVSAWASLPPPFQWLACWVLLAVALDDGRLEEAIAEAQIMITPPQYLQDEPVNTALETAVALWDEGEKSAAEARLVEAVRLAEAHHYL